MPSFLPRSKRLRTALIVVVSIAIIAVAAELLSNTANSGSKPKPTAKGHGSTVPTPANAAGALKLKIGAVVIQNTGPPAKIELPVRRVLLRAAQAYVDDAILAPLRSGVVNNAYDSAFDSGVKHAASGPDRGVLTEARFGRARGPVRATASLVRLDGIGDQNGKIALVATTFGLSVKTSTPAGPLTISRITELTFANEFGSWRVTAYDVVVHRRIGATTTSMHVSGGDPSPNGVAV